MPSLIPELDGRALTTDAALRHPEMLRNRIARLADSEILLPKFFHPYGAQVQSGALLHSVVQASDFFTTDVEKRAPGNEYTVVEGVDPEPKLALAEDWGAKFNVPDEVRTRNNISYLDQQTTQLANTIARKLDVRALEEVDAALGMENTVPGNDWSAAITVGAPDDLTPSDELPTADLSAGQLASDLQELGVKHDLLIVHPQEAHALRVLYGDKLAAVLKSAGLELFTNARLQPGTAYVCESGSVGTVGFEYPLTVTTWRDEATRSTVVQAFCVPALAVDRPYAAKKLTGLAGVGSA
jgi:hypothetical protein